MASTEQAAVILDDEQLGQMASVTFERLTGVLLREGMRISEDLVVARIAQPAEPSAADSRTIDMPLTGQAS